MGYGSTGFNVQSPAAQELVHRPHLLLDAAVRGACERKGLKPVFHFIGSKGSNRALSIKLWVTTEFKLYTVAYRRFNARVWYVMYVLWHAAPDRALSIAMGQLYST